MGKPLGAIGAVDGTDFNILRPENNQQVWYSRKKRHAVKATAIVDMDGFSSLSKLVILEACTTQIASNVPTCGKMFTYSFQNLKMNTF